MEIFLEISLITVLLTVISLLMKTLKQPFVVGFIITGILISPNALNLIKSQDSIQLFSQIGITILLYIVGLNLNPKVLKEVGISSAITGLGQVFITTVFGLIICKILGFTLLPSLYISIALTFSSTIIVLKLLADRGDLNSLYGKLSIGLLLIQDFIASFLLIGLNTQTTLLSLLSKSLLLGLVIFLFSKYLLPRLLQKLAENQELLFIFSVAYGLAMASVFTLLGFSKEVGALIAGISLSATDFATEITAKLKPLRDFFIPLFFILLGSQMNLSYLSPVLVPAIVLSLYVLIGNPIIVFVLLNLQGFQRKTAFKAGLTMAQVSEFSLILASLGLNLGHLQSYHLTLITLVGLISISGSSYLILYSDQIYKNIETFLKFFELNKHPREKKSPAQDSPQIILFGYDKSGSEFAKTISELKQRYVVVDYSPEAIHRLKTEGHPHHYGDAEDLEFLDEIGFHEVKLVISTIPNPTVNKFLVSHLKKVNPKAQIIVISHHVKDTLELYQLGASLVIVPIYFGSRYLAHLLKNGLDQEILKNERIHHLLDLTHPKDL